jgi:hypothetical protein
VEGIFVNLVNGRIIHEDDCDSDLENINGMLIETLSKPPLDIALVINACDALVKDIGSLDITKRLSEMGVSPVLAEIYMSQIVQMINANAINDRLMIELGENYHKPRTLIYSHSGETALQTIAPLGVLFHITAGHVDGLPFISLLEGLLTGNINMVKLPKEEGGITVTLLQELFKIEPSLSEYVYVFDYSSKDVHAMKKLAEAADAVIVWGGDEAVSAVRNMADPNTRIIEWGHKISFAYATKEGAKDKSALEKLATHICMTNQLFCSSCQGVFLDTDDMRDVYDFCEMFLPLLEEACIENPFVFDTAARLFIQAEVTLKEYHVRVENKGSGFRVFRDQNCSITAQPDSKLEPSVMYRNIWVKPLKRDNIMMLRSYKNYLQTAALICAEHEHEPLAQKLLQAGLVKISDGFEMSNYAFGEAHDGIFPLRCYSKLVSVQIKAG